MDAKQYTKLLGYGGCREQEIGEPQNAESAIAYIEKIMQIDEERKKKARQAQ